VAEQKFTWQTFSLPSDKHDCTGVENARNSISIPENPATTVHTKCPKQPLQEVLWFKCIVLTYGRFMTVHMTVLEYSFSRWWSHWNKYLSLSPNLAWWECSYNE